ncbi:hypothetical protein BB559_004877 [Furculomyces boomerangus]|uniref:Uncharacterized protein n=3 Tax=Harpellales TaxID=61421 RepID=A0A2T9YC58_9FUNG|nr:hypothetical protein BB559_004877 [Furculomyces boomerangus]PVZ99947.1 hypothetical protein BB558_004017 [Smittium angustum]
MSGLLNFLGFKDESEPQYRDPRDILADASEQLENKDYEKALEYFDELCSLPVQSALPFLSRATCKIQLGLWEEAVKDCNKVLLFLNSDIDENIAEGCTTIHSAALVRLAKAYKELGKMEDAQGCMIRRDAIEEKKRTRGDGNMKNGFTKSQKLVDSEFQTSEHEKQEAEKHREKGNVLYKLKKYKEALEEYRAGLGLDIMNERLHSNACLCLIQLNDLEMATRHANQCCALQPNWAKGPYLLGRIEYMRGNQSGAKDQLKKALTLDPKNTAVKNMLKDLDKGNENNSKKEQGNNLRNRKNQKKQTTANKENENDTKKDTEPTEDIKQMMTPDQNTLKNISIDICAALLGVLLTWLAVRKL